MESLEGKVVFILLKFQAINCSRPPVIVPKVKRRAETPTII